MIQLQLLFEQLVLFPIVDNEHSNKQQKLSINATVHDRLRRFKQGRIRELYHESRQVTSKSPSQQAAQPVDILKSAQDAADLDNFKTANARVTKHAPVALIGQHNYHILEKLHPPSLRRGCIKSTPTGTRSGSTRRRVRLTPHTALKVLTHLNRGKAPGLHCDSLDIYVTATRKLDLSISSDAKRAKAIASFFSHVINGQIPTSFQTYLRQTYLVALEKDTNDKTKLRPLGVPSAVRRISAILVLDEYRSSFAEYVLPFNFAIGVGGGVDVVIKTTQLAVDKYIIDKENAGELPSRSLVSLDLINMFNSVSRERLREIISSEFPALESFADLIYDGEGETFVKLENGDWSIIPVCEGFSQGCPASPVFAALVLNTIIRKIYPELEARARQRLANGDKGDDGLGGLAILMAYVDDVNSVIYHDDIEFFLRRFTELATPLGAVLNTDKTRILTSTTGTPLTETLRNTGELHHMCRGETLKRTISQYSTKKNDDGSRSAVEVTDGLRVLGTPIGSINFCSTFLQSALDRARLDSTKLLNNLEDLQTILRIYSTCTAHKITHLFGCDVYNTDFDDLPNAFYLWNSNLTTQFNDMTSSLIANVVNTTTLPPHAQLMSSISIKQGGLGIQNPRSNAIISFMSTSKRCLQYCNQGVWLGFNRPRPLLPTSIRLLYQDWESSDNRSWQIFRKYLPVFNSIATKGRHESPTDYIYKSSLNGARDKAKEYASRHIRNTILPNPSITPPEILPILPALLDKRTSMALMTMSRTDTSNRLPNKTFSTALKRKLRLRLFDDISNFKCKCGSSLDAYGDHSLGCKANNKSKASNGIRDEIIKIFRRILPIVNMIDSPTQVESEVHNVVPSLPQLKPFDLSIRLDNSLDSGAWRVPYSRIGFDVTLVHSTKPPSCTPSEAATHTISDLRLRDGEKMKFARRTGGTNKLTNRTISADDVIGEILSSNNVFIPIAVGPFGELGSMFRRFIDNVSTLPLPSFPSNRPHALRAARLATDCRTPYNLFAKSDYIWKRDHNGFFDGSYLSNSPGTWANQKLGLALCSNLANHINTSLSRTKYCNISQSQHSQGNDGELEHHEPDWRYCDGILMSQHDTADDDLLYEGGVIELDFTGVT